jgi:cytoskeletal protein RodZ
MSETNPMPAENMASTPASAPATAPAANKTNGAMVMGIFALLAILIAGGAAAFFLMQEDSDSNDNDDEQVEEDEDEEDQDDEEEEENEGEEEEEENEDESEDEDEDTGSDMDVYDGDNSSVYIFQYPSEFVVSDESDTSGSFYTYIYAKDPNEVGVGDFNPNVNITSAGYLEVTEAEADYCEEYATEVVAILEDTYESAELVDEGTTTVNGQEACKLVLEGTYFGVDLIQEQYLIFSEDEDGESFIVTLTTNAEEEAYDELMDVIDSIELLQ